MTSLTLKQIKIGIFYKVDNELIDLETKKKYSCDIDFVEIGNVCVDYRSLVPATKLLKELEGKQKIKKKDCLIILMN